MIKCPSCGHEFSAEENLVNAYSTSPQEPETTSGAKRAVPKLSDRRERFKQGKLRIDDVRAMPTILNVENPKPLIDGDGFIGPGIQQEL